MAVYDVEVLRGGGVSDGYIEARPKGVSKGLFVNHAIATMKASNNDPDFILAIGDDNSDEPMFQYLNKITGSGTGSGSATVPAAPVTGSGTGTGAGTGTGSGIAAEEVVTFTVTVGKKPSSAQTFVDDPAAVMDVLSTLIKSAQRDRRHSSAADLLASISNSSQVRYQITSCHAMPCLSLPWPFLSRVGLSLIVLSFLVLSCLFLSCLVLSCLASPYLALPCLALPCLALPCLALSCLILPYLALSCLILPNLV